MRNFFLISGLIGSTCCFSNPVAEAIYVLNYADNTVYHVDPFTGLSTLVTTTPIGSNIGCDDIKVISKDKAYVIADGQSKLYAVDLNTGASTPVTTQIGPSYGTESFRLFCDTNAFVVSGVDNKVYSVNLARGSSVPLTETLTNAQFLSDIAVKGNLAYVVDYVLMHIYIVNLNTGTFSTLIPDIPVAAGVGVDGIDVLGNTAYLTVVSADATLNQVYAVDLTTGHGTLIVDIPGVPELGHIVVVNEELAYTCGASNNLVYAINLKQNSYSILTPTPVPGTIGPNAGLFGIDVQRVWE